MITSIDKKPSICLVAHFAYGAMAETNEGHIGGVERQTSLTARWLARRGYDVSLITWDEGQPQNELIDGVRIIKLCRRNAGIPGLRFVHPRWTSLNRALRTADADVYYHNCGEYVTGQVAWWCRRHGRGFVYSIASDVDCDADFPSMKNRRERVLYRYGLLSADRVITQTLRQQQMLSEGFGLRSEIIPMPCEGPSNDEYRPLEVPADGRLRVLWVARVADVKRPDRLVEIARQCPEFHFDLVGPSNGAESSERTLAEAKQVSNITVHGGKTREQLPGLYQQAACLCCTSDYEGFPNTFLEAWSYGLPLVSTVDPDDLISKRGLGLAAADASGLAEALRELLTRPERWRQCSRNARSYYYDNHRVEAVLPKFEQIFKDVAAPASIVNQKIERRRLATEQ